VIAEPKEGFVRVFLGVPKGSASLGRVFVLRPLTAKADCVEFEFLIQAALKFFEMIVQGVGRILLKRSAKSDPERMVSFIIFCV